MAYTWLTDKELQQRSFYFSSNIIYYNCTTVELWIFELWIYKVTHKFRFQPLVSHGTAALKLVKGGDESGSEVVIYNCKVEGHRAKESGSLSLADHAPAFFCGSEG